MSGHEEKTTLQNTTVVIDKAKNCFSFYLLRQTKYIQPHKDEIQLLLFLYCWKSFMYFCKRNRDAEERKKTPTKRFSTISCRFCKFSYNTSVY